MSPWPSPSQSRFNVPWARLYAFIGKEVQTYRMHRGQRVPDRRGKLLQVYTAKIYPMKSPGPVAWIDFSFKEKGTGRGVAQQVRVMQGDQFVVEGIG